MYLMRQTTNLKPIFMTHPSSSLSNRLISLDVYRGITMFLLIAEAALVYNVLLDIFPEGNRFHGFFIQFTHHEWNGLFFWDLIQPFFMFIVGVAMPFSLLKRMSTSSDRVVVTKHILKRCLLLFLFGTGLHCVYSGKLVFELWNVLTQLSVTVLITYFLIRQSWKVQLGTAFGLLILTELLYRLYNPESPYVHGTNFGNFMDQLLMGKINNGGWVAINFIPTAAHTIWGAMCGNLLLSSKIDSDKIKYFLIAGFSFLVMGYGLDLLGITPIIKRISTSAFVFVSGGWAILALAFFYWWVDIKKHQSWAFPFLIVGMNSIFIYLFAEILGHKWLFGLMGIFGKGFLAPLGIGEHGLELITALMTLSAMWGLCYFLYQKKLFFRI